MSKGTEEIRAKEHDLGEAMISTLLKKRKLFKPGCRNNDAVDFAIAMYLTYDDEKRKDIAYNWKRITSDIMDILRTLDPNEYQWDFLVLECDLNSRIYTIVDYLENWYARKSPSGERLGIWNYTTQSYMYFCDEKIRDLIDDLESLYNEE